MLFTETPLSGAYIIELEKREDERGFFARQFCRREFTERGLSADFVQVNDSLAKTKGTLRGMHYQRPPVAETKLVRCIHGALFDIIIDLREKSPTFKQHTAVELTATNRKIFYVPKGFAHGFITLADDTEVFYFMDEFYSPEQTDGVRWNDPAFNIQWPSMPTVINDRDAGYPDFSAATHLL